VISIDEREIILSLFFSLSKTKLRRERGKREKKGDWTRNVKE